MCYAFIMFSDMLSLGYVVNKNDGVFRSAHSRKSHAFKKGIKLANNKNASRVLIKQGSALHFIQCCAPLSRFNLNKLYFRFSAFFISLSLPRRLGSFGTGGYH